jgi:hypothetical protein
MTKQYHATNSRRMTDVWSVFQPYTQCVSDSQLLVSGLGDSVQLSAVCVGFVVYKVALEQLSHRALCSSLASHHSTSSVHLS